MSVAEVVPSGYIRVVLLCIQDGYATREKGERQTERVSSRLRSLWISTQNDRELVRSIVLVGESVEHYSCVV